jgi:hypothetical protein
MIMTVDGGCNPNTKPPSTQDCDSVRPEGNCIPGCLGDWDCPVNSICNNDTWQCDCVEGFSWSNTSHCEKIDSSGGQDVSNCSLDWDVQRDRWIEKDRAWKNKTRNCDGLGDDLSDLKYNVTHSPFNQWQAIVNNYIISLNAWLKVLSPLRIPGVPSSIQFNDTNPVQLWEDIMYYSHHFSDLWYKSNGEPSGLRKLN